MSSVAQHSREQEPLLSSTSETGREPEDYNIAWNLLSDTASVAQIGIWVLAILVWYNVLSMPLMLFTGHPLLASTALLLQVQAALILQPTVTPNQKQRGTRIHFTLQLLSILCFVAAFIVIELNKGTHPHFTSPHGVLGLITIILVVLQALVGVVQYFFPITVLGSVDAGKRIYKYHRWTGYVLLLLEVATVLAATQTGFNLNAIHIPTWGVVVAVALVVVGVGARVKARKLGLGDA
ncbi:hypothetical protein POX_b03070 [Penicillium oxalicum]|uniref:Cytochrome b561 domain-containing protein n=1 Tax=Penicillium oxalicum (strain 114-2 / CGMCC 5302) TaxID=933388 RepID=S7ZML3_PENO1|nr:hypothetical protein POX_b03070 [Penicillium oxalicum]EPS29911.1 hypothetical protein PDE_04861 [Penicillium oxalicum 114-2]KAI2793024.1 hypothetical protein POX_b03070 [Penicillium oxalicum]